MGSACVLLNDSERSIDHSPTIIVSGAARSGTSMVAAALDAAGLWLGNNLDGACFEDVDLAFATERRLPPHRRAARMASAPHLWRSALKGLDMAGLAVALAARDAHYAAWGFKRPNVLQRLGRDGLALFRNPKIVLCLRDPVALAQRSVIADGVSMKEAMRNARRQIDGAMRMAETLECPTLLVSFEKVKEDRQGFLAELSDFCALTVEASHYAEIHAKIERAGEKYSRLASAPTVGFLDKPLGWSLSGWCAAPGSTGPSAIDVLADGIKLVTTFADGYRPDLVITGCRSAYRGFQVDLRQLGLRGSEIIEVVLSGSGTRLHESGYQLAPA